METLGDALRLLGVPEKTLEHYGVKGMRWGIRRSPSQLREAAAARRQPRNVSVKSKPGAPIKTSGGQNHPASSDATRAAALRQKARASGSQSLNNAELQALLTRTRLEQEYGKILASQQSASKGSKARAFILDTVADVAKSEAKELAKYAAATPRRNLKDKNKK